MISNRIRMRKKSKGGGEPIETWDGIFADPEVGRVLHVNGLIADANKSSIEELSQITTLDDYFNYNSIITQFPELKYCTGLTNLRYTFTHCTNLTEIIIPDSVTNMYNTFYECSSLVDAPIIPNSVIDLQYTFDGCYNLINAPIIPNSVTNMNRTFSYCSGLINAPIIPNSVTNMNGTFSYCSGLINAPIIPNSVTNMNGTFMNCSSLVEAPIIPEGVMGMSQIFQECTSLDGIFIIKPVNPPSYDYTFEDINVVTIYVPDESVDSYKTASGWSDHSSKIYPISQLPK